MFARARLELSSPISNIRMTSTSNQPTRGGFGDTILDNLEQMRSFGYRLKQGYSDRRVGSKVYVLGPDGAMHILENATAVFLWDQIRIGDHVSIDGLAGALVSQFKVTLEIARSDVAEFVTSLVQFGVLEETPAEENS